MDRLGRINTALDGIRARFAAKDGVIATLRRQAEEREDKLARLRAAVEGVGLVPTLAELKTLMNTIKELLTD